MKALLIVDMENDFMPTGALGVPHADEIIPTINELIPCFPLVIACLDYHPEDHVSFAKNHPGKKPGDVIEMNGVSQILWPVHCVRNTFGSQFVKTLHQEKIAAQFYKGTDPKMDSYSAFFDNAPSHMRKKSTGLEEYLREKKVTELYIAGIATEYCVLYSALDAKGLGFSVFVVQDACRAINLQKDDEKKAFLQMRKKGIQIIQANEVKKA